MKFKPLFRKPIVTCDGLVELFLDEDNLDKIKCIILSDLNIMKKIEICNNIKNGHEIDEDEEIEIRNEIFSFIDPILREIGEDYHVFTVDILELIISEKFGD